MSFWGYFADAASLPNVGVDVGASALTFGDSAFVGVQPYVCINPAASPNAVWISGPPLTTLALPAKMFDWQAQGNGTTVSLFGFGNVTTGTATARSVSIGTVAGSQRQLAFVSAAAAGSSCGTRHGLLQFYRGDVVGRAGFLYQTRFVIDTVTAGLRWFVGVLGSAAVIGNVDPTTLTNLVGVGINAGQTTVRIMSNDAAGTATATDLGANFPAATAGSVYELTVYSAPNGADIRWRLRRLDQVFVAEGTLTTDIPGSTTLLAPQIWLNNGASASPLAISVVYQSIGTET